MSIVRKAGLKLVSIKTDIVRCPYHQKWLAEPSDPAAYAKWFIPTLRTWSNHTFYAG